jgi:hypothetical protein
VIVTPAGISTGSFPIRLRLICYLSLMQGKVFVFVLAYQTDSSRKISRLHSQFIISVIVAYLG